MKTLLIWSYILFIAGITGSTTGVFLDSLNTIVYGAVSVVSGIFVQCVVHFHEWRKKNIP